MIRLSISPSQAAELFEGYQKHPHAKVRRRMGVLYFKSRGIAHQEICGLFQITKPTLCSILKRYESGGIASLKQLNYKGQPSKLHAFSAQLKQAFSDRPATSINEARQRIKEMTGLEGSPTQIRLFMKHLGLGLLKTGHIPGGEKGNSKKKS